MYCNHPRKNASFRWPLLFSCLFLTAQADQAKAQSANHEPSQKAFSGYVEDAESGERLIGVALYVQDRNMVTTTNNYGFFSLNANQAEVLLSVSYMGYQSLDTLIRPDGKGQILIKLAVAKGELNEVVITSGSRKTIQEDAQMSKVSLSAAQIKALPRFFGEADVLKALQLMPGVQQGSEGTSALLVRGGSPDQNLILLDGAPIYNPAHLLGIFSTFNVSTIKNVDLYKGAFPSRFGGRVSSVVDIATKDGNMQEIHGDFSVGLLASQLTLEGPIKKGKTTFMISGRRTYGDLFAAPLAKMASSNEVSPTLYFYDFNVKVQHRFTDNDRLFLSVYGGKDKFGAKINTEGDKSKAGITWGNYLGTIRWNHIFSNKLFSNVTLLATDFGLDINSEYKSSYGGTSTDEKMALSSGIRDYGGKIDLDYFPHHNHKIKFGAGITHHQFTPGTTRFSTTENGVVVNNTTSKEFNSRNNEIDVYAEDDWKISEKLNANIGLHWSALTGSGTSYQQLQPRLSARYILPGDIGLKVSYARMAQYMHLLSGNTITLPTDLWVPVTNRTKPQLADQFAAGFARSIMKNTIELSVEGYYKKLDNVIEYRDGATYIVASSEKSWEEQVTAGTGKAYGIELMAQKKEGRFTGWVAYTLSRTERTLPEVNFGRTFPYKYDRRHDFKTVGTYRLSKGIEVTGCFIFQSAMPFTMAYSQYEEAAENPANSTIEDVKNITARNNVRIEPYHRLDVGINFIKEKKKGRTRTWNISCYNVYNRRNPFYYYQSNNSGNTRIMKLSLLPVLPSISYSLKF